VDQCEHPHQFLACQQRNTNYRLNPGFVHGIVRAHQPAFVLACIEDQHGFPIANDPSRQPALYRVTQLDRGMFVELLAVHNGRIDCLAVIIKYDNTTALTAHISEDFIQHALKHGTQVESSRDLTADIV
jgi:hypothetical protein